MATAGKYVTGYSGEDSNSFRFPKGNVFASSSDTNVIPFPTGNVFDSKLYTKGVYTTPSSANTIKGNGIGGTSSMDIQKYIELLDLERRESEKRIRDERRESESRWEQRQAELEERMEKRFGSIENHFDRMEKKFDRMDQKIEGLSGEIRREGDSTKKWMIGVFVTVVAIALTTIFGIVQMVVAVF